MTDGQYYFLTVFFLSCVLMVLWAVAGYVGARLWFPHPRWHQHRIHHEAERIIREEERHGR